MVCAGFFLFLHFFIVLVPGYVSCIFRMNCINEYNWAGSVYEMGPVPLQNPFNMTLMPQDFRIFLAILLASNMIIVLCWEYFVVGIGWGKRFCQSFNTFIRGRVGKDSMSASTKEGLNFAETEETAENGSPKCDEEASSNHAFHDKSENENNGSSKRLDEASFKGDGVGVKEKGEDS